MKLLKFLFLMLVRILALPLVILLQILCVITALITELGSMILSVPILFVLFNGIWYAVKRDWNDVLLLAIIEGGLILISLCAQWLSEGLQVLCGTLIAFLYG